MGNKFMTVIYDVSQPEMKEKVKKLLAAADWTAAGWSHAFADRDEARAALYKLQESSSAAPQVVADERKLPPLPQYFPDIVNIRADEELRAQDYATQYARAALQAAPVHAQELSDATIINAANKYGISPHAAMPFVRELIAAQSTVQEIRAVANPVEFDGIKTAPVQAQEPFMFGIMGPDGKAHIDENCVAGDKDSTALNIEVNCLNDSPDSGYSIVPLFRAPVQPVAVPDGKPFAHFVQPSGFGPFIECHPNQVGSFPAYRSSPAAQGDAKDTERLRWLAETGARISWSMDGEYCAVWLPDERDGTESRPAEGYPLKCYDSWHRAIDAATAAKAAS